MNAFLNILSAPFRWISSLFLRILFIIFLVVLLLLVTPGWYVPFIAKKVVYYKTGFPVTIGESHINIFTGKIDFLDISIQNPDSFAEKKFVDVKELSLHIEPLSIFKEIFVCDRFIFKIENVSWVKSDQQEVNLEAFVQSLEGEPKDAQKEEHSTTEAEPSPPAPMPEFLMKKFELTLNTVNQYDFTKSPPKEKEYKLGFEFQIENARSVEEILKPLMSQLTKEGVSFLAQSFLDSLLDSETYKGIAKDLLDGIPGLDSAGEGISKGLENIFKVFE
ncbi:MAG TPA: hypothetical protein DIU37_05585 [Opitutae bacterium]|nr:hypothetical protein [Opitutae bacterium]|tara:strand:- start:2109 stop:2936 length:828 start_codon:yes stop_codon:yes gene_type:complete